MKTKLQIYKCAFFNQFLLDEINRYPPIGMHVKLTSCDL